MKYFLLLANQNGSVENLWIIWSLSNHLNKDNHPSSVFDHSHLSFEVKKKNPPSPWTAQINFAMITALIFLKENKWSEHENDKTAHLHSKPWSNGVGFFQGKTSPLKLDPEIFPKSIKSIKHNIYTSKQYCYTVLKIILQKNKKQNKNQVPGNSWSVVKKKKKKR